MFQYWFIFMFMMVNYGSYGNESRATQLLINRRQFHHCMWFTTKNMVSCSGSPRNNHWTSFNLAQHQDGMTNHRPCRDKPSPQQPHPVSSSHVHPRWNPTYPHPNLPMKSTNPWRAMIPRDHPNWGRTASKWVWLWPWFHMVSYSAEAGFGRARSTQFIAILSRKPYYPAQAIDEEGTSTLASVINWCFATGSYTQIKGVSRHWTYLNMIISLATLTPWPSQPPTDSEKSSILTSYIAGDDRSGLGGHMLRGRQPIQLATIGGRQIQHRNQLQQLFLQLPQHLEEVASRVMLNWRKDLPPEVMLNQWRIGRHHGWWVAESCSALMVGWW